MRDAMDDRIQKIITAHGRRVKELDDERRQVQREIEERKDRLRAIDAESEKEMFAIRTVEEALDDDAREKSWTAHHRNRRPGDPLSVVVLLTQVLENHPEGVNLPVMLAEMRKLGFQTDAKSPMGILRSTLDRREETFFRLKTGRWCLKKYAPARLQNVVQFR